MNKLPKILPSSDLTTASQICSVSNVRRKSSTSPLKAQQQSAHVRKLETERRKLISVESQQIIAVLDDALITLEIISRFAPICEEYDYFESILGSEIASGFRHLCTAFSYESSCEKEIAAEAEATFVSSMKNMTSTQKLAMYSAPAMKRISQLVKTLAQLIVEKRDLFNSVNTDCEPSSRMYDLLQSMEELRRFMLERLLTTEAKEKEQILFLDNSPTREKILKDKIDELEIELSRVKSSTAEEVDNRTEKIADLEDDIEKMITISSEAILQRRMETFHEIEQEEKHSRDRRVVLDSEYQTSLRQYDSMLDQHRNAELNLRKKNFKISVEVENWIMKYDKDMSDRLVMLETLNDEYITEQENLAKLELKFAPVEEEYRLLMAERSAKEQKRLAGMLKEVKYVNAAVIIQKYMRGFLARKRFKQLKKKKK